jgi:hypothetical protein
LFAYESNLKPVVGQQVTLTKMNRERAIARANLLMDRARAGDAELVARARLNDMARGYLLGSDGLFISDRREEPSVGFEAMLAEAIDTGATLTLTAVPIGAGQRIALDRNEDGVLDGDDMMVPGTTNYGYKTSRACRKVSSKASSCLASNTK